MNPFNVSSPKLPAAALNNANSKARQNGQGKSDTAGDNGAAHGSANGNVNANTNANAPSGHPVQGTPTGTDANPNSANSGTKMVAIPDVAVENQNQQVFDQKHDPNYHAGVFQVVQNKINENFHVVKAPNTPQTPPTPTEACVKDDPVEDASGDWTVTDLDPADTTRGKWTVTDKAPEQATSHWKVTDMTSDNKGNGLNTSSTNSANSNDVASYGEQNGKKTADKKGTG